MPYRRRNPGRKVYRTKRRKVYRSKRSMARRTGMRTASKAIMRNPSGFPDRIFVKLNYSDIVSGNVSSGVAADNIFHGNSSYSPRTTGGHQPYGFDQWAQFYSHYRVHGSSIQAQFLPTSTGSGLVTSMWATVYPSLTATPDSYPYPIQEMPYSKTKMFNIYSAGNKENMISKYISTAKILGIPRTAANDVINYSAATNANPSILWYWHVVTGSVDAASSVTIYFRFKVTQYVEFFRRNQLNYS